MRRLTPFFLVCVWTFAAFPLLAATDTVTNTNDSGAGSYREALTDANTNPGLDTIAFNVSGAGCDGAGVCRIAPTAPLTTAAPSSPATTSHRSRPRPLTTLTTEPSNSRSSQTTKSPDSPGRFRAFFSRLLE